MISTPTIRARPRRRSLAWLCLLAFADLGGCASLLPKPPAPPTLYVLEDASSDPAEALSAQAPVAARTLTLVVNEPRAAPGYGTRQIAYVRLADRLEYFAFSQWVEPPALMLAPLLVRAVERTGAFRAVVRAPLSVAGDMRLETELVRLQQDFRPAPSRVRLTVHAVLIDTATRRVLAARDFDVQVSSASEDPSGGVIAANQAVRLVAADVGAFCAEWVAKAK